MNRPTVAQALLQGGPADGAVREVECGPDGRPPELLLLGAAGVVFVGSSDEPAPPAGHPVYELEPGAEPIEAWWPYRYVETLYQ